ncbi:MAG: YeiH family protein [Alphaproteobacteria bacterium]
MASDLSLRAPAALGASDKGSPWPGLLLTAAIAAFAFLPRAATGWTMLNPLVVAILLGIAWRSLARVPAAAARGLALSQRGVLRFAIALLGLQISVAHVAAIGWIGATVALTCLIAAFLFTRALGRWLGVEPQLATLIAAGTSICGASAIAAVNAATRAPEEDAAYAIACITLFGTAAMLLYPLIAALLPLGPHAYGLWSGATLHELGQAVAAAFQQGDAAGQSGTVAKLLRVAALPAMVLLLAWGRASAAKTGAPRAAMPWFVLGFAVCMILGNLVDLPAGPKAWANHAALFLLCMGLAAMGLATNLSKLRAKGWRPLLAAGGGTLFIATLGLVLTLWLV